MAGAMAMNAATYGQPEVDINQGSNAPVSERPTAEEEADIKLVLKCFEEGKTFREKYDKNWDKWEKHYDGEQWEQKRSAGKSMPVINIYRPVIQTTLPIMTDTQPAFEASPRIPQDYEFADMVSKLVANWWERTTMSVTLVQTIMSSLMYHCGAQKVIWDTEAENGAGEVRVDDIDPRDIYVPKGAIDFNKNCRWIIHRFFKPLGECRRKFPGKADLIFASGAGKELDTQRISSLSGDINLVSPINKKARDVPLEAAPGTPDDNQDVELMELWIDDEGLKEAELVDKETGEKKIVQKKKYPGGKIIVIAVQNKVHLATIPNPRKDGMKPFVKYVNMVRPKRFYGDGEIDQLYDLQRMVNKTVAVLFDTMNLMGNPCWIVDSNSGVNPDLITNVVGQVIVKNAGTEVKRDQAPSPPPFIIQFYELLMRHVDQISGVHDVTQGRKPTGVTAGYAIESLQEAAQTRMRLKERNLNASLCQLGYLVISTMMQYYRSTRVAKIAGGESQWPDYFEFYLKDVDDGKVQAVRQDYKYDKDKSSYVAQPLKEMQPSRGIFDIKVSSGTSLPYAKSQRSNLAMALFDKQAIDQEALLNAVDFPESEKIMRRMNDEKQKVAAAQAQNPQGGQQ
jgi:hypothetical protein